MRAIVILEFELDDQRLDVIAGKVAEAGYDASEGRIVRKIRMGIHETADLVLRTFDELDKPERHGKHVTGQAGIVETDG